MPINKKRKLGPKTVDCVFLGYAIHSVGYRFLIINSSVPEMAVDTIMESRDATFFENEFPMKNAPSTTSHEFIIPHEHENFTLLEQIEEPYVQNPEEDDTIVTRKSKRQRTAKYFGDDYIVYLVDDTPTTIEEAYSSPNADLWKEAVRSEIDSVMSNETWEISTSSHCPSLLVHQFRSADDFLWLWFLQAKCFGRRNCASNSNRPLSSWQGELSPN